MVWQRGTVQQHCNGNPFFRPFLWKVNWTVPKWKLFGTVILIIIITAVRANPRHKMNLCLMHSLSLSLKMWLVSQCVFFFLVVCFILSWCILCYGSFCCFCSVLLIHKPRTIKYNKNNASPLSHTSSHNSHTLSSTHPKQPWCWCHRLDSPCHSEVHGSLMSVQCSGIYTGTNNMKNACQTILHILLAVDQV